MNWLVRLLRLNVGPYDEYGQINQVDDLLGNAADIPAAQPARTVRADHQQVNRFGVSKVDNVFCRFPLTNRINHAQVNFIFAPALLRLIPQGPTHTGCDPLHIHIRLCLADLPA